MRRLEAALGIIALFVIAFGLYFLPSYFRERVTVTSSVSTLQSPVTTTSKSRVAVLVVVHGYALWKNDHWVVILGIKNVGNTTAVIDKVFVNGRAFRNISLPIRIEPGKNTTLNLLLYPGLGYSHGQMISVKLYCSDGRTYYRTIVLP